MMLHVISMNNEFVYICFNQKPIRAPTARSARSFSRSDLRGTAELYREKKQMTGWKIGLWSSFCNTLWQTNIAMEYPHVQ